MKKKVLSALTVCMILMTTIAFAKEPQEIRERTFQFGFITPLGTNGNLSRLTINKISLNILGGHSYGNTLLEIGGLYNINTSITKGLQIAGLVNYTDDTHNAIQIAGLANMTRNGTVFAQIGGLINGAADIKGVQIGTLVNGAGDVNGLQIGGALANATGSITGAQIGGGILNGAGDVSGLQIGGALINAAGSITGAQIGGGLLNGAGDVEGVQIGGLFNASGSVTGVQIGGLFNATGDITGAQISGLLNGAGSVEGVQLASLINGAGSVEGVQIGIINGVGHLKGVQIGLINYVHESEGLSIGLINIVKNGGKQEFEVSFSDAINTEITFKSGTDKFYNIISGGIKYLPTTAIEYAVGLGFGTHIDWVNGWGNQIELVVHTVTEDSNFPIGFMSNLYQLKLTVSKEFAKHFKVFAGPVVNFSVSNYKNLQTGEFGNSLASWSMWQTTVKNTQLEAWIGLSAGVRF